jgi:phage shock protein A
MGILSRFKDIMAANINALLDKAEDPSKMIDQYLRNLESDLGKVKAETAAVMAEESRAKRELEECDYEIDKYQKYAEKAVRAGNDGDAKRFLVQKNALVEKRAALAQAYAMAADNAAKMKSMHDKLVNDIAALNAKRDAIKAKVQVAKTQEKLNQVGSSLNGVGDHLAAFDKMEAKANQMLDQANAMAELNASEQTSSLEELASKYEEASSPAVDDELAALKAAMGMTSEE